MSWGETVTRRVDALLGILEFEKFEFLCEMNEPTTVPGDVFSLPFHLFTSPNSSLCQPQRGTLPS